MLQLIILVIIGYFGYQYFFGTESGCDAYASKFSCSYVRDEATYKVFYWHNVENNDPKDEKLIGTAVGLPACKQTAVIYARSINRTWNERSYICMLVRDGRNLEKHRL